MNQFPDTELQRHFETLGACTKGRTWVGSKNSTEAWEQLDNPNWVFWWYTNVKLIPKKIAVQIAIDCAELVLFLVPPQEQRPKLAIEAAKNWLKNPTSGVNAVEAACAARAASAASYAVEAARAASYAASCASAASYAASCAARAASGASYAVEAASYAASVTASAASVCNIIRKYLEQPWKESQSI